MVFLVVWPTKWPQYVLILSTPLSLAAGYGARLALAPVGRKAARGPARRATRRRGGEAGPGPFRARSSRHAARPPDRRAVAGAGPRRLPAPGADPARVRVRDVADRPAAQLAPRRDQRRRDPRGRRRDDRPDPGRRRSTSARNSKTVHYVGGDLLGAFQSGIWLGGQTIGRVRGVLAPVDDPVGRAAGGARDRRRDSCWSDRASASPGSGGSCSSCRGRSRRSSAAIAWRDVLEPNQGLLAQLAGQPGRLARQPRRRAWSCCWSRPPGSAGRCGCWWPRPGCGRSRGASTEAAALDGAGRLPAVPRRHAAAAAARCSARRS